MSITMNDEVTDSDIEALKAEAIAVGDYKQAGLCTRALRGLETARTECERVIRDARAQR